MLGWDRPRDRTGVESMAHVRLVAPTALLLFACLGCATAEKPSDSSKERVEWWPNGVMVFWKGSRIVGVAHNVGAGPEDPVEDWAMSGLAVNLHDGGNVRSIEFHDRETGELQVRHYDKDGTLRQTGRSIHGKPHGEFRLYYPNGQLQSLRFFDEGELVTKSMWGKDGQHWWTKTAEELQELRDD
jgi:hypothetical protein